MKFTAICGLLALALALALAGCLPPDVDISALSPEHQEWFAEAAKIENIGITLISSEWWVEYDYSLDHNGWVYPLGILCLILINPGNMNACVDGGLEQKFKVVVRHELRHCEFKPHVSDPSKLMFSITPCWPVD